MVQLICSETVLRHVAGEPNVEAGCPKKPAVVVIWYEHNYAGKVVKRRRVSCRWHYRPWTEDARPDGLPVTTAIELDSV